MARKKKSTFRLSKGDLLFYKGYLIYCEGKSKHNTWRFSCPFMPDFILTKDEILVDCKK